ncbi:MAG: hypothetical protein QNJ36_11785 [Calothrix sp. MO_167.B42]|nr:hypothetical protein [Calothrix sp. MO_167.B42]
MQHPFALKISDLKSQLLEKDLVEELGNNEADSISGGLSIYTIEGKEEGGSYDPCLQPICPPIEVTTHAIGKEGGDYPIEVEPKPEPIKPIKPPYATTLAIGEEGGDCPVLY